MFHGCYGCIHIADRALLEVGVALDNSGAVILSSVETLGRSYIHQHDRLAKGHKEDKFCLSYQKKQGEV